MDAKDLRIGNIIECVLVEYRVTMVDSKNSVSGISLHNPDDNELVLDDMWYPIPLTEEWLLKAGLRKEGSRYYIGHEYWVQQDCNHWVMIEMDEWVEITSFDYVHEFQNAYKVILKKEVEFNNE